MTQIEENLTRLAEWSGLKKEYIQEGVNIGIEKGIDKALLDMTRKAISKGLTNELIMDMTGFTIEKINEIRNNLN